LDRADPSFPRREAPTLPRQVPESAGRGSRALRADLGDRQVSCRGSQADFLRVFSRVLGSMGLREVKVTGFQLRVVLRNHLSGRCFRAFS